MSTPSSGRPAPMTLRDGQPGMKLRVLAIADGELKERLMTMGVLPETTVTVLRAAPFGDPMAIRVRTYDLALRRADAAGIAVQPVERRAPKGGHDAP